MCRFLLLLSPDSPGSSAYLIGGKSSLSIPFQRIASRDQDYSENLNGSYLMSSKALKHKRESTDLIMLKTNLYFGGRMKVSFLSWKI